MVQSLPGQYLSQNKTCRSGGQCDHTYKRDLETHSRVAITTNPHGWSIFRPQIHLDIPWDSQGLSIYSSIFVPGAKCSKLANQSNWSDREGWWNQSDFTLETTNLGSGKSVVGTATPRRRLRRRTARSIGPASGPASTSGCEPPPEGCEPEDVERSSALSAARIHLNAMC